MVVPTKSLGSDRDLVECSTCPGSEQYMTDEKEVQESKIIGRKLHKYSKFFIFLVREFREIWPDGGANKQVSHQTPN